MPRSAKPRLTFEQAWRALSVEQRLAVRMLCRTECPMLLAANPDVSPAFPNKPPKGMNTFIDQEAMAAALDMVPGLRHKLHVVVHEGKMLDELKFWLHFFSHVTAINKKKLTLQMVTATLPPEPVKEENKMPPLPLKRLRDDLGDILGEHSRVFLQKALEPIGGLLAKKELTQKGAIATQTICTQTDDDGMSDVSGPGPAPTGGAHGDAVMVDVQ